MDHSNQIDALLPPQMAEKAETLGVQKAQLDFWTMLGLSILAGAFIALGAVFSTTVAAGTGGTFPYGVTRLLVGVVFSVGLILVVVGGAELFTGNNLIIMAWASGKIPTALLLRNWGIVFLGNFLGAVLTALLVAWSGQFQFGDGVVGKTALSIAKAKVELGFLSAVCLGILCNALVCLAVWLSFSARSTTDRILAVVPPISAFVAAGFEHSIANMYFVPVALLIKSFAPDSFWLAIEASPEDYQQLTWGAFLLRNLLPVTVGNIIGGTLLVGGVYWFIYLRKRPRD